MSTRDSENNRLSSLRGLVSSIGRTEVPIDRLRIRSDQTTQQLLAAYLEAGRWKQKDSVTFKGTYSGIILEFRGDEIDVYWPSSYGVVIPRQSRSFGSIHAKGLQVVIQEIKDAIRISDPEAQVEEVPATIVSTRPFVYTIRIVGPAFVIGIVLFFLLR